MKNQLDYQEALKIVEDFVNNKINTGPGHDQTVRCAIETLTGFGNPTLGRKNLARFAMLVYDIQTGE